MEGLRRGRLRFSQPVAAILLRPSPDLTETELSRQPRTLDPSMKLLLGILAIVLIAATFVADYKWRQWMEARRRDREQ